MVEQRHECILHQGIVAQGSAVEGIAEIVGGGEGSVGIREVGVRHDEISRIVVRSQAVLVLVGMCLGHTVLLSSTHGILCREAVAEVGRKVLDSLVDLLLGAFGEIVDNVDIALEMLSRARRLVHGKLVAGVVKIQARLQREGGTAQHHQIYKVLFHDMN